MSPSNTQDHAGAEEQPAGEVQEDLAKVQRREKYIEIILAHWPPNWSTRFAALDVVLEKLGLDERPRPGRGPSVTVIKHFAIMSFWMSFAEADIHLTDRIKSRRKDQGNPSNKDNWHCMPADVKWVLLNKLNGVGEGMSWEDLAADALGYRE